MADREKVIKGLECCSEHIEDASCTDCPYVDDCDIGECTSELAHDALTLLKEQEAKTVLNAGRQAVGNNKVFYGNCPNCQRRLYAKTSNYCQYCGQKVKWEC